MGSDPRVCDLGNHALPFSKSRVGLFAFSLTPRSFTPFYVFFSSFSILEDNLPRFSDSKHLNWLGSSLFGGLLALFMFCLLKHEEK